MKNEAKEILKIARYVLSGEKMSFRYQDIGHGAGSVIWWVDNSGKIKTFVSTGKEYHHELNKKMDMDNRWRGRMEKGGVVTMLPPLKIYNREIGEIVLPDAIMTQLEKMGGKTFYMDTAYGGMKRVAKIKK